MPRKERLNLDGRLWDILGEIGSEDKTGINTAVAEVKKLIQNNYRRRKYKKKGNKKC